MAFSPGSVLLLQPLLQHLGRRLQVNHQVGRRNVLPEQIVVAVVNLQLVIAQVQAGKQLVFLEDVIGNDRLVGIALHVQRGQLLIPRDQKGKLRLEGRTALSVVEALEERVALRFADALRVQRLRDDLAQRALADSDGAFNGDIARRFEQVCHGTIRFAEYRPRRTCGNDSVATFCGNPPEARSAAFVGRLESTPPGAVFSIHYPLPTIHF